VALHRKSGKHITLILHLFNNQVTQQYGTNLGNKKSV